MSTTSTFAAYRNRPPAHTLPLHSSPRIYKWHGGDWGFGLDHVDDSDAGEAGASPISAEAAERYRFNPMPPKTSC